MVETPSRPSRPWNEDENQSACRYKGLRAESVREATHLRLDGCGRKGLISHWGFLMEPLGGFMEGWQRVAEGSEDRGETGR